MICLVPTTQPYGIQVPVYYTVLGRQHLTMKLTSQLLKTLLYNQLKLKIVLYYHLLMEQNLNLKLYGVYFV